MTSGGAHGLHMLSQMHSQESAIVSLNTREKFLKRTYPGFRGVLVRAGVASVCPSVSNSVSLSSSARHLGESCTVTDLLDAETQKEYFPVMLHFDLLYSKYYHIMLFPILTYL